MFCQKISQLHKIETYDPNIQNTYVPTEALGGSPRGGVKRKTRRERVSLIQYLES